MSKVFLKFKKELVKGGLEWFGLFYGDYRAVVVDNEDPDFRGRIKIKCPSVYGSDSPNLWAEPKGMFSGANIGFYAIPQKDDPVWLTFQGGDAQFPLWQYGWYAKGKAPEGADHQVFTFQVQDGSRMVMDTKNEKVLLYRKDGRVVELSNSGISIGSEGGSAQPGVLGDDNATTFNQIIDQVNIALDGIIAFCSAQEGAAGSVPVLAPLIPGYVALKTVSTAVKTALTVTKSGQVPLTKSTVVTLD